MYKWNIETRQIEDKLDVGIAMADCRSNPRPKGRYSLRRMSGKSYTLFVFDNNVYRQNIGHSNAVILNPSVSLVLSRFLLIIITP